MKNLFLALALIFALPAWTEAALRMPTPEICANGIDDDDNNLIDDGCPVSSTSVTITNGLAFDMADSRRDGTITTDTSNESSSGTFIKNTGNYRQGQWALDGNTTGTTCANVACYPWVKVRVPLTGNILNNRIWIADTPFTQASRNEALTFVPAIDPPPSFSWVKLAGSFTKNGAFILYGLMTSTVEIDCLALVTNSSAVQVTANPECPTAVVPTGVAHDATGTAQAGSAVTTLAIPITVGASGNHLHCGVSHRTTTNTITSVVSNVNGALTLVPNGWVASGSVGNGMFFLSGPTVGAHNITVTFSAAQNAAGNCDSYSGVSQTAPYGAVSTLNGSSNVSLDVASGPDQLVIDHLSVSVDNAETITAATGQTQRWQKEVDVATGANRVSVSSDKQGDSSVSMGYTITGTSAWSYLLTTLHPPSAGGGGGAGVPVLGTPTTSLIGLDSFIASADVDDTSATCIGRRGPSGGPYTGGTTATAGTTGGKCRVTFTGLAQNTGYFYVIEATNPNGAGTSAQAAVTTDVQISSMGITQLELNIWNQRRVSGPYRVRGDAGADSPEDWTRINTNAEAFRASPDADYWLGSTASGCLSDDDLTLSTTVKDAARRARDGAFKAWLMNDTDLKVKAVARLHKQATQFSNADFTNTTKWCANSLASDTLFHPAELVVMMLRTMDYIEALDAAAFTTQQRNDLAAWFTAFAVAGDESIRVNLDSMFTDREADNYTLTQPHDTAGVVAWYEADGTPAPNCSIYCRRWNNRKNSVANVTAQISVYFGLTSIKTHMKRYGKELVMFGIFPEPTGLVTDFTRWWATNGVYSPERGFLYASSVLAFILELAETFARDGDSSVFDFVTSTGAYLSVGGQKSLLAALRGMFNYTDGTHSRYGSDVPANWGDINYRIDGVNLHSDGRQRLNSLYLVPGNLYYRDAYVKGAYTRTGPGTIPYPSIADSVNGTLDYQGAAGALPGVLFMYGQMEGLVWPYPGATP